MFTADSELFVGAATYGRPGDLAHGMREGMSSSAMDYRMKFLLRAALGSVCLS